MSWGHQHTGEETPSESGEVRYQEPDTIPCEPSTVYQMMYFTDMTESGKIVPSRPVLVRKYRNLEGGFAHICTIDREIYELIITDSDLLLFFSQALEIAVNTLLQSGFNPKHSSIHLFMWNDHEIPDWKEVIMRIRIPTDGLLDRRGFWNRLNFHLYRRFPAPFLKTSVEEY